MSALRNIGDILLNYHEGLLAGLAVTLKLCAAVWIIGLSVGTLLGIAAARFDKLIGLPTRAGGFILTGLPILVLLFWLHYPLQAILGVVIDPFITAAVAIGIVNVLAVAETARVAIRSVPRQYLEAALVCGVPGKTRLWRVEVPL